MDIKIGASTWPPQSSEDYIPKSLKKDKKDLLSNPDCAFALVVYGESSGILVQLLELKTWFEDQTIFHFYSCSVLMMYEKELAIEGRSSGAVVKLVDFAHVVEGRGVIDHNFLGGLYSLIKFILEIFTTPDEYPAKACMEGKSSGTAVKLVDFAHVVEGGGVIDHNFLGGLSLIKFISEILTTPDEYPAKACLLDTEKNRLCFENSVME
ncbi:inositol polyphosphate kinase 2 alpha [Actinidia rufa]|uniref:Inositol polyphosphate multikinase n=1 Tax=Actinidia rufa TaxID=165716 RepID=A0A7J0H2P3_9ERIC|nr:inositol polyphosphate kinase 2 alpha [Actinidia rufa]